jgi:hypothetical protein
MAALGGVTARGGVGALGGVAAWGGVGTFGGVAARGGVGALGGITARGGMGALGGVDMRCAPCALCQHASGISSSSSSPSLKPTTTLCRFWLLS